MFKFIIFSIIVFYLLTKVIGFLFRTMISMMGQNASRYQENGNYRTNTYRKPSEGNINIDYIPQDKKNKKEFEGGEYVDYEEVK